MKEQISLEKAIDAYSRYCKRKGYIYQQPCRYSSDLDSKGNNWILRNSNGELATVNAASGRIVES